MVSSTQGSTNHLDVPNYIFYCICIFEDPLGCSAIKEPFYETGNAMYTNREIYARDRANLFTYNNEWMQHNSDVMASDNNSTLEIHGSSIEFFCYIIINGIISTLSGHG